MLLVICVPLLSMIASYTAAKDDFGMVREDNRHYGAFTETIDQHLKHLAEGKFDCQYNRRHNKHEMSKNYIRNKTVTCNDGTPSGYYIRRSVISSRWLVYLDGGWFCHDTASCKLRSLNTPSLMTSKFWPPTKQGFGILSTNQAENPLFHEANIVYVPYCSSDAWSGSKHPKIKGDYAFLGSLILDNVIKDLVQIHGLDQASKMFLAGSSAGGTGVIINLDRIAGLMSSLAPRVEVRGIVDSGWFLDNQQYKKTGCEHIHSCAPTESIQRGMHFWGGVLPVNCVKQYSAQEMWRCYFGYRVYPTLKTPVFVIQHLFDEAQLTVDNVGTPFKQDQWQYIHDIGQDTRQTLRNVSAVFAPACLSHILLTRGEWLTVSVGGVTLPEAIACWEEGTYERNLYSRRSNGRSNLALAERLITGVGPKDDKLPADSPSVVLRTESPHQSNNRPTKNPGRKPRNRQRLKRKRDRRRRAKQKERERRRLEKLAEREKQREERKALQRLDKSKRESQQAQHQIDSNPQQSVANQRPSKKQLRRGHRNLYLDPEPNFDFDISNPRTLRSNNQAEQHREEAVLVTQKPKGRHSKSSARTATLEGNNRRTSRPKQRSKIANSYQAEQPSSQASSGQSEQRSQNAKSDQSGQRSRKASSGQSEKRSRKAISDQSEERSRNGKAGQSERRLKHGLVFDEHDVHHMEAHGNQCKHHVIDHCTFPQCNPTCPTIYDPFTGAEMDFMDMFMQFGLDTAGIADSLDLESDDIRQNKDLLLSLLFNSGK